MENDLSEEDKAASLKATSKRPSLNFTEMGLNIGDVLTWKDDPKIKVVIISDRKIKYTKS